MTLVAQSLDRQSLSGEAWELRLSHDVLAVQELLPAGLQELHGTVVARARDAAAHSLVLSGSTARGMRTEISDLDYHLVGRKIDTRDLSPELDLHVLSPEKLEMDVVEGDDFIQWSLRFGCVIFDDGVLRDALQLMLHRRPWPDADRKRRHAAKSLELARRVVDSGDQDGALLQVRTALTLAARAHLLTQGEFPMTRAELPGQLKAAGRLAAADALDTCIHAEPSLDVLRDAVLHGQALFGEATWAAVTQRE